MADRAHPAQSRDCYDQLRRLLIHSQIRPGVRLVESDWAKRLKVHRTSLREALSMLAHEGLLRRGQRGGYFTPEYEQRDLDEIWSVRSIMETGALRMLAQRPPGDVGLDALDAALSAMEAMFAADFEMGFLEADRRFHQTIVELSGNRRLIELYNRAPIPLALSPVVDRAARRAVLQSALDDHREVARLIRTGQTDDAIERLQEHLHQAHRPSPVY